MYNETNLNIFLDKKKWKFIELIKEKGRVFIVFSCAHDILHKVRNDNILNIKDCKCNKDALPPGARIGRLVVLSRDKPNRLVSCLCDCGSLITVHDTNLFRTNTFSCGCFHKERISIVKKTHGHTSQGKTSSEYRTYTNMKTRCYNPKCKEYPYYGGRGIRVCNRWLESFENFLEDMEEKPEPKKAYSIDRIDTNANYELSNCRWATKKQQCSNRRTRKDAVQEINCQHCDIVFLPKKKAQIYCTLQCAKKPKKLSL